MFTSQKPLTTGEIATYCGVSRVGVLRWIKSGRLKAYRTPGGHFRITPQDFEAFLSETDFPPPQPAETHPLNRILVVTQNSVVLGNVVRLLSTMLGQLEIDVAMDVGLAVAKLAVFRPHLVVFDAAEAGCDIVQFTEKIERIVQKRYPLPALLLANAVLTPSEIADLANMFSPIVVEPALPQHPADNAATRFTEIIRRLLTD